MKKIICLFMVLSLLFIITFYGIIQNSIWNEPIMIIKERHIILNKVFSFFITLNKASQAYEKIGRETLLKNVIIKNRRGDINEKDN